MFENNITKTEEKKIKTPRKISKKRLKNIALYYLERYESSVQNLREVLQKRVLKYKMFFPDYNPKEAYEWIEEIVEEFKNLGYVDDNRFAEMKINSYLSAGKPARYIRIKLIEKGISPIITNKILEEKEFSPFEMAMKFAQKKKIGPFTPDKEQRKKNWQKDLGKIVRAGFDYDVALDVLNTEEISQ